MVNKSELFQGLSDAIVAMDEKRTAELARLVVEDRIDAYEAIEKGLSHGMERTGQLFEQSEYFLPELLLCSDAMYAGLEVLKPQMKVDGPGMQGKVVIGVIEGDTHEIGKNLVKMMLEASRFKVFDLGRDISPVKFIEKAKEIDADLIAISTLMSTTMKNMERVLRLLEDEGLRQRFRVIVGGGPITQGFADRIGADGYAANAAGAVKVAEDLLKEENE